MSRNHGDRNDSDNKIRLLKKQAEVLKREVTHLRKENRPLRDAVGEIDLEPDDNDFIESEKKARKRGEGLTCEACNKGTYMAFTISVRGVDKTYLTCGVCGDRKPQK
jgi:hypothetical protein